MVKALDLKSNGVSPRRFESCRLRIILIILALLSIFAPKVSTHFFQINYLLKFIFSWGATWWWNIILYKSCMMFIWRKLLTTLYERSVYAAITFCESVWFMIFPLLEIVIKTTAREKRNKLQYEMVNGWLKWAIYFSDTWQKNFPLTDVGRKC